MSSNEQEALAKQGSNVWNQWRMAYPNVAVDLSMADLRAAELSNVDFRDANLEGGDLRGAKLFMANFRNANLKRSSFADASLVEAHLHFADLQDADLSAADLRNAGLRGADLRRSDLHRAVLFGTDLDDADVSGATVGGTVFGFLDLRRIRGLKGLIHYRPSTVGIETLDLSGGEVPQEFLRGAGLSDALIAYAKTVGKRALEFYSCFISYSTRDQDFADRLHSDLQDKGVRCWFAPEDLKIGERFRQRIDEAIRVHEKLLVILSEHSVRSDWVREEVESCFEREHREKRTVLFPVRLDDAIMDTNQAWAASIRSQRHIGDFRKWNDHDAYQKAFERLMRDLKANSERKLGL